MLLGIWENIEDLENKINLEELNVILEAARERDYRNHRFMAALKGIDIDAASKEEQESRFEEVKRRAEARLQGKSVDELIMDDLGMEVEIEE